MGSTLRSAANSLHLLMSRLSDWGRINGPELDPRGHAAAAYGELEKLHFELSAIGTETAGLPFPGSPPADATGSIPGGSTLGGPGMNAGPHAKPPQSEPPLVKHGPGGDFTRSVRADHGARLIDVLA